jgi:hypothetical protein
MSSKKQTYQDIAERLAKIIDIAETVIRDSGTIPDETKQHLLNWGQQVKYMALNPEPQFRRVASLKSLESTFLIYWNESIGIDTEVFWNELRQKEIECNRKEPLRNALQKGRFRNVHEGMEAAKNFDNLINSRLLESSFLNKDLLQLKKIILEDTNQRIELLKRCLKKGAIPGSKYLRFGDSVAYMNECKLWSKYFKEDEVQRLMEIWSNFK